MEDPSRAAPDPGGRVQDTVAPRLAEVRDRLAAAARRAGREAADVTLVVVTKGVADGVVALLPGLGVADIGESRVQDAHRRRGSLSALPLRWHMIGHLQTNKVRRALETFDRVHSVDRDAVLDALDAEATRRGRVVDCLLQVNVSAEPSKRGYATGDVAAALRRARGLRSVRVTGLMAIPAPALREGDNRDAFAGLRALRDSLRASPSDLPDLSMGMSDDYAVAVEEGATLVRVGTALFEDLPANLFARPAAGAGGPV